MKIGNKMAKALAVLSFALLCVFALLVPSFAEGEVARVYDAENTEVGVYQTLNEALDAVTEGGTVELLGNTTLEGTKTEADGYAYVTDKSFTLTGGDNKYTVTLTGKGDSSTANAGNDKRRSYINIIKGTLTLKNITISSDEETYAQTVKTSPYGVFSVTGGTLVMDDGARIYKGAGRNGSALFLGGGNVLMKSGSAIDSCKGMTDSGAVYVYSPKSTFTMDGGEIKNNFNAVNSIEGAITVRRGSAVINGGTISGNGSSQKAGNAAINVSADASLTVGDGAVISGNYGYSQTKGFSVFAATGAAIQDTIPGNTKATIPGVDGTFFIDNDTVGTNKVMSISSAKAVSFFPSLYDAIGPNGNTGNKSTAVLLADDSITTGNTAGGARQVKIGMDYSIDGNGHTLSIASNVEIFARQKLNISNITIEKTETTANNAQGTRALYLQGSEGVGSNVTLTNVTLKTAGGSENNGVGIYLNDAYCTLNLENTSISGFGVSINAVKGSTVTGEPAGSNKFDLVTDGSEMWIDSSKKIAVYFRNAWIFHTDFADALPAGQDSRYNGATMYLLSDVEINEGTANANDVKFGGTLIIEGRGKTIKVAAGKSIWSRQVLTLNNLTVEKTASADNDCAIKQNAGGETTPTIVTLNNVTMNTAGGDKSGTGVLLNNDYASLYVNNSSFTGFYNAIAIANGKVDLSNATIKNNGIGVLFAKGDLNVIGNTVVDENTPITGSDVNKKRNIFFNIGNAQNLTVKKGFTGKIGVHGIPGAAKNETVPGTFSSQGVLFGYVEDGATLADTASVVSDNDPLFAFVNDNNMLEWTKAHSLNIKTDKGKYVKGEATYGVIRALTTSTNDAETPLEYYGTAFVISEGDQITAANKCDLTGNATFGKDKGFIVDMVEEGSSVTLIDSTTYTYIPVSYYKIKGIDAVQYVYGAPVTFNKATEKTVEYTD